MIEVKDTMPIFLMGIPLLIAVSALTAAVRKRFFLALALLVLALVLLVALVASVPK